MSDAAAISSMVNAQTINQVGIAVARKTLDAQEAQGDAAIKLLEGAVELQQQGAPTSPHLGNQLDVRG